MLDEAFMAVRGASVGAGARGVRARVALRGREQRVPQSACDSRQRARRRAREAATHVEALGSARRSPRRSALDPSSGRRAPAATPWRAFRTRWRRWAASARSGGLPTQEVAEVIGVALGTVKSRMHETVRRCERRRRRCCSDEPVLPRARLPRRSPRSSLRSSRTTSACSPRARANPSRHTSCRAPHACARSSM